MQGNETLPCCFLPASFRGFSKSNFEGDSSVERGNKKSLLPLCLHRPMMLRVIKDVFDPVCYHPALFIQNLCFPNPARVMNAVFSRARERTRLARPFHAFCVQTIYEFLLINNDGSCFAGGGSAGCNLLYQLSKKNVNAVLLERAQMTAGTTWHTAGLVWRLRPNDVEIQLLATTRDTLMSLEAETGLDSGWIQNGGLFISHSPQRTNEYRRLQTLGKCFGIESHILSPDETQKVFPLLDPKAFENSLYSPGDGVVDPAMMCAALTRASNANGGRVIENCPVDELIIGESLMGAKDVRGVKTPYGEY